MNKIIGWAVNISGAGKSAWAFLDGKKAYGTAALTILGAAAGLGSELAPILASHNTAALIAFVTHINSDPAYLALLAGFAIVAGAHKADKVIAATVAAQPAPVPPSES